MDRVMKAVRNSWWAILLTLLAFATGLGAHTQQINNHEQRITALEQNIITRNEYSEMLKRFDRIDQQSNRIENKIDQHQRDASLRNLR